MLAHLRRHGFAYGIAIVTVALVTIARFAIVRWLGEDSPLLLSETTVLAAAWYGGLLPGLFATLLAGITAMIVTTGDHLPLDTGVEQFRLAGFFVVGVIISGIAEVGLRYRRRLEDKQRRLENELAWRKEGEAKIDRLYAQLRLVTDHAPVFISHGSADRRYRFVNKPYADRFGLRLDEIVGKSVAEVLGADAYAVIEPYMSLALQGRPTQFEAEIPIRGLGNRWMRVAYEPERDTQGRVVGYVSAATDTTQRRRAEEMLRERERMLAQSQQMAHVGGWEMELQDPVDLRRNKLRWTDESYRLFGFEPGSIEVTTDLFLSLIPRDDHENVINAARQAIASHASYDLEHRVVLRNGGERIIHERATIVTAPDGRPVRMLGTAQDVTERRQIEEALRASEQQFRLLADAMPQMAWITTARGRVVYVNRRWQDYTGLGLALSQSPTLLECVVHPDDLPTVRQAWSDSIEAGKDYELQMRFKRAADGTYRWFLSRGVAVRDRNGAVMQWFGTATDIEYQKRAEEELREADRRKDEFLAMLAHELRNPLAPIRHGLQLMRMPAATSKTHERARHMMERQTTQMARLIDDLLDVSRISRGKLELRKERIDLATAVHSAVETISPIIDAVGHTFDVQLPNGATPLNADLTRLAQVFSNLLNNAAKYTPPGGHISLTAERHMTEVVVTVKDNGIGIAPEKLRTIFDMFVQADRSFEGSRGGLGIGLTLAKRLVEMHGGRIEAHSLGRGKGSELVVRLPLALAPIEPRPAPSSHPGTNDGERLSILVVDDNVDSAESLAAVLKLMGHDTAVAHDGLRALDIAKSFRPNVVLLDIGMPRLNGYETARRLRATSWGKDMLLIALTGWGQEKDKRLAREAGFDHHVTKPLEPNSLLRLLSTRQSSTNQPA